MWRSYYRNGKELRWKIQVRWGVNIATHLGRPITLAQAESVWGTVFCSPSWELQNHVYQLGVMEKTWNSEGKWLAVFSCAFPLHASIPAQLRARFLILAIPVLERQGGLIHCSAGFAPVISGDGLDVLQGINPSPSFLHMPFFIVKCNIERNHYDNKSCCAWEWSAQGTKKPKPCLQTVLSTLKQPTFGFCPCPSFGFLLYLGTLAGGDDSC